MRRKIDGRSSKELLFFVIIYCGFCGRGKCCTVIIGEISFGGFLIV